MTYVTNKERSRLLTTQFERSDACNRVVGLEDARYVRYSQTHRHRYERINRAISSINLFNFRILRKQNVIGIGQPRMVAASNGHRNDTETAWAANRTIVPCLTNLTKTKHLKFTSRTTSSSNNEIWKRVENGTQIEDNLNQCEQCVI